MHSHLSRAYLDVVCFDQRAVSACQPIARGQLDTMPYATNVKALARVVTDVLRRTASQSAVYGQCGETDRREEQL